MVRRGQMLNNEWLDQFDFPRPQEKFNVGVNYVHAIHPVLDEFLFTEAGNISVASVGLLSGGTVLLVAVGCFICCCCCPSFRQCSFAACTRISSSIYNGCTTEHWACTAGMSILTVNTKTNQYHLFLCFIVHYAWKPRTIEYHVYVINCLSTCMYDVNVCIMYI